MNRQPIIRRRDELLYTYVSGLSLPRDYATPVLNSSPSCSNILLYARAHQEQFCVSPRKTPVGLRFKAAGFGFGWGTLIV
jgi:hypothetical protein